jgi:hypothetical protein
MAICFAVAKETEARIPVIFVKIRDGTANFGDEQSVTRPVMRPEGCDGANDSQRGLPMCPRRRESRSAGFSNDCADLGIP